MSPYTVAFDLNGTVKSLTCKQVKIGNMFLQCIGETSQNDQVVLARIPFDSVEYVSHESLTISADDLAREQASGDGDAADDS